MSDRLAISASFSILMMAAYLLFGGQAQRVPFGPGAEAPAQAEAGLLPDLAAPVRAVVARD